MNKSIRRILIGTVLFLMGVMILLAILILTKTVCINKMFVSDDDIIGVDVSEYQDKIDMKRLSEQNIDFVYIRATEGSSYQDACFRENWKNAHECGLLAGAYHFFSFDSSGETQARNYIETVGELEGDLIPVVDFEYYGDKEKNRPDKEKVLRELHIFLEILEKENNSKPTVEHVQDTVEKVLIENGHARTAKEYILYRAERTRIREMNTKLMKIYDESKTYNDPGDNVERREESDCRRPLPRV